MYQTTTILMVWVTLVALVTISLTFNKFLERKIRAEIIGAALTSGEFGERLYALPFLNEENMLCRRWQMSHFLAFTPSTVGLVLCGTSLAMGQQTDFLIFMARTSPYIRELLAFMPDWFYILFYSGIGRILLVMFFVLCFSKSISYGLRGMFNVPICYINQEGPFKSVAVVWWKFWTPFEFW